jgi:hypothetical protein
MAARIKHNNYVAKPKDIFARERLGARSPRAGDTSPTLDPKDVLKRTPASVWDLGKKS